MTQHQSVKMPQASGLNKIFLAVVQYMQCKSRHSLGRGGSHFENKLCIEIQIFVCSVIWMNAANCYVAFVSDTFLEF